MGGGGGGGYPKYEYEHKRKESNNNTNMNTHMNMNIHDVVFSLVPLRSGSSISGQEEEGIRKKQLPQTSNKMMITTSTDFGQQQANHQQQH